MYFKIFQKNHGGKPQASVKGMSGDDVDERWAKHLKADLPGEAKPA